MHEVYVSGIFLESIYHSGKYIHEKKTQALELHNIKIQKYIVPIARE